VRRRLHEQPIAVALIGALVLAFSGILYRVAHVSPATGAVFRCLYALPPLWLLSRWEDRKYGPRPLKQRALAWLAGLFFAVDLIAWHQGIEEVGAGLATVLGNLQVVLVGLLAWAMLRERPSNRSLAAIPVALLGVVLISGTLEQGAYGRNPGLGVAFGILTALSYAGFLLVLRQGNKDLRRPAGRSSTRHSSPGSAASGSGSSSGTSTGRRDGRRRVTCYSWRGAHRCSAGC